MKYEFIHILLVFIGLFSGYLISYFKEKGKNKALLEDNQALTNEIEKIKQEYSLDLQKRKYKYETKQKLYYEFMDKLDTYNALGMNLFFDELGAIMMNFYESNTEEKKKKYTIEFNNTARDIDTKMKKQTSELFSQLNQLKLTTNEEVLSLLEELHNELNRINIKFIEIAKSIPALLTNHNANTEIQKFDTHSNSKIVNIKDKLIKILKNELNT